MLDLMHDGEPYGNLTAGGVPITPADLARLIGKPAKSVEKWLVELESRKVFSRTDAKVIYSRRMVRDEDLRNRRAKGGGESLKNENVPKPKDGDKDGSKDGSTPSLPGSSGPSLGGSPASASAFASAVAVDPSSSEHRIRLVAAANRGLAEHERRPQPIPLILVGQASTLETIEEFATAGIDIGFAERTVYELAKGHKSLDGVSGLKFFLRGTMKAWSRRAAKMDSDNSQVRSAPRTPSLEDRARLILAIANTHGLTSYIGNPDDYRRRQAEAADDPRAFPDFLETIKPLDLAHGIGNQPEPFALKELVRRIESAPTNGVHA
jgi:hypothetical protein